MVASTGELSLSVPTPPYNQEGQELRKRKEFEKKKEKQKRRPQGGWKPRRFPTGAPPTDGVKKEDGGQQGESWDQGKKR